MGIEFRHRIGNLRGLAAQLNGPVPAKIAKQWGAMYLGFVRTRFDRCSQGQGDWAPLAPSTIAGRRFARGKTIGRARADVLEKLRRVRSAKAAETGVRKLKAVGHAAGKVTIMRNTGTLYRALTIGAPGNLFKQLNQGSKSTVRVGFDGAKKHSSGKATIAQIAEFHQRGGKHLPRREIIVRPDQQTIAAMQEVASRELERAFSANLKKTL